MTGLEILLAGALLLALACLTIVTLGARDVTAELHRERRRRATADRLMVREARANVDLREKVADLQVRLALQSDHPAVGVRPLAPVIDFPRRGGA